MKRFLLPAFLFTIAMGAARAEEGDSTRSQATAGNEEMTKLSGKVDGLMEDYLETKNTVAGLAKLKVGGYVQAQWQHLDSIGGPVLAGGNMPVNTDRRLQVRRARLKTTYDAGTSKYILEIEALPGGITPAGLTASGVALKDVEILLLEPWLKTFSLDFGVMDRPFGFEVSYSSSLIETPERSRFENNFFSGEKDLGVALGIDPGADMGFLKYLNFKGGLYTGTGGMSPTFDEIDREMDFIGRLGFKAPMPDIGLDIDGGFSAYLGQVEDASDTAFDVSGKGFTASTGHRLKTFDRQVFGVDAQLYYDLPVIGGTSLRAEYEWGQMPGTSGSAKPYAPTTAVGPFSNAAATAAGAPNLYMRNVAGWYITWVQNLGSRFQGVLRYDMYDPNTDVEGKDIGVAANKGLGVADIGINTLGYGLIYHWSGNLKFTAFYDMVMNEEVNGAAAGGLAAWKKDLNDNLFTFRAQVKF
jgi:hypothetical protein